MGRSGRLHQQQRTSRRGSYKKPWLSYLTGAVHPYVIVKGVVGHPVTLPCIYSVYTGISYISWDFGECQYFNNYYKSIIRANAYQVTYRRSSRYQLKGRISEGNVSLTIENAVQSDSGLYCCLTKIPGSFHSVTYSLDVKPVKLPPTGELSPLPCPAPFWLIDDKEQKSSRTAFLGTDSYWRYKLLSFLARLDPCFIFIFQIQKFLQVLQQDPQQGDPRLCQQDPHVYQHHPESPPLLLEHQCTRRLTHQESIPSWKQQKNMSKGFYIGVSTAALLLLLLVCTVVITRYILMKKKSGSLSLVAFHADKIGTLQKTEVIRSRAEDNAYIVEDSPTLQNESQKPS
ncbi:Hepatitis A virus cellular receptor 1 homolog [Lemmus lemmus]